MREALESEESDAREVYDEVDLGEAIQDNYRPDDSDVFFLHFSLLEIVPPVVPVGEHFGRRTPLLKLFDTVLSCSVDCRVPSADEFNGYYSAEVSDKLTVVRIVEIFEWL